MLLMLLTHGVAMTLVGVVACAKTIFDTSGHNGNMAKGARR